jgi:dolichol-phosphate mannosyltransferase
MIQPMSLLFTESSKAVTTVSLGRGSFRGRRVIGYPKFKLVLNRLANLMIRTLFVVRYNDVTNAFKLYRRNAIAGIQPLLSHHFLT